MVGEAKIFAHMNVSWRCKKYEKMQIKCTEQSNLWGNCLFSQEDSIKLAKKRHFPIQIFTLKWIWKTLAQKEEQWKRHFWFSVNSDQAWKESMDQWRDTEEKNNSYLVFEWNIHHAQFPNLSSDISFNDDITSILLLGVSLLRCGCDRGTKFS